MYKFGPFIFMINAIFFCIWAPYLRHLGKKIWRTKGMLNMIPMDIIKTNPVLEENILSKNIFNAMK